MRRIFATLLVVGLCSCSADPGTLRKIQVCLDKGGTPSYNENGLTGAPTEFYYCTPGKTK